MKTKKHIYLLPVLALLSACADEFGREAAGLEESRKVKMSIECSIDQHYLSRVNDGGFADGDAIGVYVVDYADGRAGDVNEPTVHAKNVRHVYQSDALRWEAEAPIYWLDNNTHVDAYGYYPFVSVIEDAHAVRHEIMKRQDKEMDNTSMTAYEASDFLWAKHTDAAPMSTLELSHRHVMSSVLVSLIEGDDFDTDEWAQTEKAVTITNTVLSTTVDLADGKVTVDADAKTESIIPRNSGNDWRAIVAPQQVAAGVPLVEISIEGDLYRFTRPGVTDYLPGKLHKLVIKVDKRQKGDYTFTLVDEAITAWEADIISHGGDARSYITVNVPRAGGLKTAIDEAGLNYKNVLNLKISGELNDDDFRFILGNLIFIEAINLSDARTVDCTINWKKENDVLPDYAFYSNYGDVGYEDQPTSLPYLKYIVFPKKLVKIGKSAFRATSLTQNIVLPEGLEYIGDHAFYNVGSSYTMNIFKVTIPSTLKYLGDGAFSGCTMRQDILLPDEMEYLGAYVFSGCSSLSGELHIPHGITNIKNDAFYANRSLSGWLEIPGHVEEIKEGAFAGTGFTGLTINEGVKIIGEKAFASLNLDYYVSSSPILARYYSKLFTGDLVLPQSLERTDDYAFAGTGFNHVYFRNSPEQLPKGLFAYCSELLDTFYIPQKVNHLDKYVFLGCKKLSAIVLPENLLTIDAACFAFCYGLDYIQCLSPTPPRLLGSSHFEGVAKDNFTLVVPKGSVDAYRNAPGWNEFRRISEYRGFVCRPQTARLLNKSNVRSVILNADGGWTVEHQPGWMHVDKTSGSKKTELKVTIDALQHGSPTRSDSIVFRLTGTDITTCYKVEQYDYLHDEDEGIALQTATKGNGIKIVFIGDGYDARDITDETYLNDMRQSMEYFFDVEPFKTYRDRFTVYTAFAMSYDSGIGTVNTIRDVKFGTFVGDGKTRMSCDFDKALYYCVDNTPVTEEDIDKLTCVVIPNTNAYDGVTYMYSGTYGHGASVALCPKSDSPYPFDARGVVQHEAGGHGFGKFADEYIYHAAWIQTCGCNCCEHTDGLQRMHYAGWGKNMSLTGKYGEVAWNHLIEDNRFNDLADIYEGGYFHSRGVYRSEHNSCMNNNVPYYSTWCRELIVKRIMDISGEQFSFEDFAARDSKEWGRDFTLPGRSRAERDIPLSAPSEGRHPIIKNRPPERPANQNR